MARGVKFIFSAGSCCFLCASLANAPRTDASVRLGETSLNSHDSTNSCAIRCPTSFCRHGHHAGPGENIAVSSAEARRSGASLVTTRWSVVLRAASSDTTRAGDALSRLYQTYWYPLYAYVRSRGYTREDAEDLTQGFFARLRKNGSFLLTVKGTVSLLSVDRLETIPGGSMGQGPRAKARRRANTPAVALRFRRNPLQPGTAGCRDA